MNRIACMLLAALGLALFVQQGHAEVLPSIDEEIIVPGWWVIGPFQSGVREAGVDPLARNTDAISFDEPLLQPSFPSVLVPGAKARWRYYPSDEDGGISVDYPEVPEETLDLINDEWGFTGTLTRGVAFATIEISDGPRRALVDLQRAGGFRLNDLPYPGDSYGHRMCLTPVLLESGSNKFEIGIGSRQGFSLKLLPVEEEILPLVKSATIPDLVRGEDPLLLAAIPILNTTQRWITVTAIEVDDNTIYNTAHLAEASIAPLCLYNCPIYFQPSSTRVAEDYADDEYALPLAITYDAGQIEFELKFRVRDPQDSRKVTFDSAIDNSVQYYGLLEPTGYDQSEHYGLILSLHGAGVDAAGQANSYQSKDWAFIVAPTNRRRYGFDWQDWGRLDMLEVLADVQAHYSIDPNRVHLTGHSMGGHGTWINAFTYPDLWASASPSAGWTTFDLYVPMFLRRNLTLGAPRASFLWHLAMREDNTLMLAENALNLPIYALEGGADDNVPPQQPRLLATVLARMGYDITYEEVPAQGHWWNIEGTPFTDCVDNEFHNDFWRMNTRHQWPREVVFRTHNISINDRAYWVRVIAPLQVYDDVVVRAEARQDNLVIVTTANVQALALKLVEPLVSDSEVEAEIDGQRLLISVDSSSEVELVRDGDKWELGEYAPAFPQKGQHTYGPWKQVLMNPFVVVYGTIGTSEQTEWNLQLARLYAFNWWYRANGRVQVVADYEYEALAWPHNVVLLGGPECNGVTAGLIGDLPIQPVEEGVLVGDRILLRTDLTYKFVYPNPHNDWQTLVLIEGGTSLEAMKRLSSTIAIYSGAGFPDWMVWNDEFKLKGLGGVAASGFFDLNWCIDPTLTFWNEELISRWH